MLHLVGQNFWQERRKCRTPGGTFFSKSSLCTAAPPSPQKKKKGLFRIACAAPAWGGVAVHRLPKTYDGP